MPSGPGKETVFSSKAPRPRDSIETDSIEHNSFAQTVAAPSAETTRMTGAPEDSVTGASGGKS